MMWEMNSMDNNVLELKLPPLNDWFTDISDTSLFLKKLKYGKKVVVSAENLCFIEPGGMLLLTLICSVIYNKTSNTVKLINISHTVKLYLERMDFFKYDFVDNEIIYEGEKWLRDHKTNSLVELSYLTSPYPSMTEVLNRLKDILYIWIFNKDNEDEEVICSHIISIIMEICNNSFEHSIIKKDTLVVCGSCFFLAQVYNPQNIKEVVIAIGDTGIGIRKSLEKNMSGYLKMMHK